MMNFNLTGAPEGLAGLFTLVAVVVAVLTLIVHIYFAIAVGTDAGRLHSRGDGPLFVGPGIWATATLLGGVLAAGLYWAMHHSRLRPRRPPKEPVVERHPPEAGGAPPQPPAPPAPPEQ